VTTSSRAEHHRQQTATRTTLGRIKQGTPRV
jgi:hypothetical protein